jgi:hypothetical protein
MALQIKVESQGRDLVAIQAKLEEIQKRCDELDARLEQKLAEAVEERIALPPIKVPRLSPTLKALGIGHEPRKKEA